MQAIETEFKGPTNTRGARIIARAQAGRITVPWNHNVSVEENHDDAARALAQKWGWHGTWVRGARPDDKGNVYVCIKRECQDGYRKPHPQAADALSTLYVAAKGSPPMVLP